MTLRFTALPLPVLLLACLSVAAPLRAQSTTPAVPASARQTTTDTLPVNPKTGTVLPSSRLSSAKAADDNLLLGTDAGTYLLNATGNTMVGNRAGGFAGVASRNVFVGLEAGRYASSTGNTMVGYKAGYGGDANSDLTGTDNTFLGLHTGYFATTAQANVVGGKEAGYRLATGSYNVLLGDQAGYTTTISETVFVGSKAGFTNTTGRYGTYIGFESGYSTVADSNTFIGYKAGRAVTTGKVNTYIGIGTGRSNPTGSYNTVVGNRAGNASTMGNENVFFGYNAGHGAGGNRNTFIGAGAGVGDTGPERFLTNASAIGAGAEVASSNALVLGNRVNVGIGTPAPAQKLEIVADQPDQSGLRLARLTSRSPTATMTDQFLTVDAAGDVTLARYRLRIGSANEWADRVFAPAYRLKPLAEVEQFVKDNRHLPNVPGAEAVVQQGVDAASLTITLLEKVEELTLYLIDLKKQYEQLQRRNSQLEERVKRVENHP